MEPQNTTFSHVSISVHVQFRTYEFLVIAMQFHLTNSLSEHGTLLPKFPARLRTHIRVCVCVCIYAHDRDRGRERTHAYACQLIFKKHVCWLLRKREVPFWNYACYEPLLQSRFSLSQHRTPDKLRHVPLPPVYVSCSSCLTFRHHASSILGQAFRYSPENAFYIFHQQIYFIIWYLLDRASLI